MPESKCIAGETCAARRDTIDAQIKGFESGAAIRHEVITEQVKNIKKVIEDSVELTRKERVELNTQNWKDLTARFDKIDIAQRNMEIKIRDTVKQVAPILDVKDAVEKCEEKHSTKKEEERFWAAYGKKLTMGAIGFVALAAIGYNQFAGLLDLSIDPGFEKIKMYIKCAQNNDNAGDYCRGLLSED